MTWNFATSHIGHDGTGGLTMEVCHHFGGAFSSGVFWLSSPPLPDGTRGRDVYCPMCMADRGLTVSGAWGGPARLTCVCGHSWTPSLPGHTPESLLRALVRLALVPDPGPGMSARRMRHAPNVPPAQPLVTAVLPHVREAGHSLHLREWIFTEDEGRIAVDVLIAVGCRMLAGPLLL